MPLVRDLVPISLSLRRSQIVVQKVVTDTHAIQQVSGGQIDVRLAEAVAPYLIAHGRIHIELCCGKIFRVALYLIGALLLFAYTLSQSISGRLYDRYGGRLGFTVSIIIWCAAAMAHSAIIGFTSFAACSFFLGLGEAGNWPGAAKVVAEWFPQEERAIGMAVFNGGASMGGVIAPLLVGRLLDPLFGWRISFLIVGALGFIWLAAWLAIYRPLSQHPRVSEKEREYIMEGQPAVVQSTAPPLASLLALRQTWGILLARFLVDPTGGSICSGCLPISRRFAISA
jgi:MFS family permease